MEIFFGSALFLLMQIFFQINEHNTQFAITVINALKHALLEHWMIQPYLEKVSALKFVLN
jgi:hypothetical protein